MSKRFLQFSEGASLTENQAAANAFITSVNTALGYTAGQKTTSYGANFTYSGNIVRVEVLDGVYPLLTAPQQAATFDDFKSLIKLTSPVQYQVYQRNGSNQANVVIKGTYGGTNSRALEASFNGGSFQQVSTGLTGGDFTLTLPSQNAGQGTFTIRPVGDTAAAVTVSNVGIGDVFVLAGQSNHGEQAINTKTYSHATLKATVFNRSANASAWADLQTTPAYWPLFATSHMASQGVPCAFICAAIGGTSIEEWQPSSTALYTNPSGFNPFGVGLNLYNRMLSMIASTNAGGVKAVLWHQGEADAGLGTTQAVYNAKLDTIANQVNAALGVKLMPAKMQICKDTNNIALAYGPIQAAQAEAWADNTNVLTGPDFSDLTSDQDGFGYVHLRSDTNVAAQGTRWWNAIKAAYSFA